tara:strand:+ start:2306 stop:3004 length:699 start_codon:yes stop_codon:yes gene_type:complete
MKAFIIYIKNHEGSTATANLTLESCEKHGYSAELYEGITPSTLSAWEEKYKLENKVLNPSHMYDRQIGINGSEFTYQCKYSNFLNHYTLWNKCVELDEKIIILEHDALAVSEWKNPKFDELLVLNVRSGLYGEELDKLRKPELYKGVHDYKNKYLNYKAKNIWFDASMIPGTASYAISPKGAKRLISNIKKYGWDKADYIVNNKSVHMQYIQPDYFHFSHHIIKNQRTSHGE